LCFKIVTDKPDFTSGDTVVPTEEPQLLVPGPDAVDVTPEKDHGILKELIRAGTGNEGPLCGDRVLVHYDAMLVNGQCIDSSRFRNAGFEFILGKGESWILILYTANLCSSV
jgi:FKBP-type peptidyl-prolyl cis-trans isomerase